MDILTNGLGLCLQEAQAYAEENSLLFMETSAKTAMNVNDIFLAIGEWEKKLFSIWKNNKSAYHYWRVI